MLVLAGEVDGPGGDSFHRRYGLEPARIDGIDAGSVTSFSAPAFDLLLDHLEAAERSGRRVAVHRSAQVERLREGTAP